MSENKVNQNTENQNESQDDTEHLVLDVSGMNCSHCSDSVTSHIQKLPAVISVSVDLGNGKVHIAGHLLDKEKIVEIVNDLGFSCSS